MEISHDKVPKEVLSLLYLNQTAFLPRQQEHQKHMREIMDKINSDALSNVTLPVSESEASAGAGSVSEDTPKVELKNTIILK